MNLESLKPSRLCSVCDKTLYGRSDKIFCDIHCKNKYHSDQRKRTNTASAVSIKLLQKNYIILCGLLGSPCDKYVIKKLELKKLGFNFNVVSGVALTPYGLKFSLFEFSWFYSRNDNVTILADKHESTISPFLYKRWERHVKPLQTAAAS